MGLASKLVSINDFHAKQGPMKTKFLDTLARYLLTNHNIYIYQEATVRSNQAAFGICPTTKPVLPAEIKTELETVFHILK